MYIVSRLEDSQDIAGHNCGSDDSDAEDESWTVDRGPCARRADAGPARLAPRPTGDIIELGAPGTFDVGAVHEGCGGPAPQPCKLRPELFGAAAMVEVKSDLMKMTICQLKDELAARGAPRTGQLKSVLRARLRALIIAHHAMAAAHVRRGAAPMCAGS